jgi:hypothetical protein
MRPAAPGLRRKRAEFWVGFALWLGVNGVVGGLLFARWAFSIPSGGGATARLNVALPFTLLGSVDIGALVVLWLNRRYVAIGMLVALVAAVGAGLTGYVILLAATSLMIGGLPIFGFVILLVGLVAECFALAFGLRAVDRRIR